MIPQFPIESQIALVILGLIFFVYGVHYYFKPKWELELLYPRWRLPVGREKKRIINMEIAGRRFNGVKAGRYTLILTKGTLEEYASPIYRGILERMYSYKLAKERVKEKPIVERPRYIGAFIELFYMIREAFTVKLPELKMRDYVLIGEFATPNEVLRRLWPDIEERELAKVEMRARGLLSPKTIWFRPIHEEKEKEVLFAIRLLPQLEEEYMVRLDDIVKEYQRTLYQINDSLADLLTTIIPLSRYIVRSVSDPFFVMGLIIADKARQVTGLGLEQLAKKGGLEAFKSALKEIMKHRDEIIKEFEKITPVKIEEKITELGGRVSEMEEAMHGIEKTLIEIRQRLALPVLPSPMKPPIKE